MLFQPRFYAIALPLLGIALFVGLWMQATFLNGLLNIIHIYTLPLLLLAVAAGVAFFGASLDKGAVVILGGLLGIGAVGIGAYGGYLETKSYNDATRLTTTPIPSYQTRAPYEVAQRLAPNALRSNSDLNSAETTFVPQTGAYTTLGHTRSWLGGYNEAVSQTLSPSGKPTTHNCTFSPSAKASLDGTLSRNLKRSIIKADRNIRINDDNAYVYCSGKTPIVVVPFTKLVGFFPVTESPGGVALYNGSTGRTAVYHDVKAGQVPGPVYPVNLAEKQRDATRARGGFMDFVFNRAGWITTGNEDDDPNRDNNGEFTLRSSKGVDYVTPLVPNSRQSAIDAVATTDAASLREGRLNPVTIHRLKTPRNSNTNVASGLKGTYSELSWATPGFTVFEIVPSAHNEWVATVGLNQTITNRIAIKADGSTCLQTPNGQTLRCVGADGERKGQPSTGSTTSPSNSGTASIPKDLSSLNDKQLAELGQRIANEQVRRAR